MEVTSPPRRRRFRSKSEILELLQQQQQSGLTIQAFCDQHSIPSGSFHNWKKKFGTAYERSSAFTPVQISSSVTLFAEVNGIKIYQPVSAGFLKELAS
jgi:transposase-like protein